MKTKNIQQSAMMHTNMSVQIDILQAKYEGYDELTYTAEPLVGPYVTIDLNDYDENGKEKV